MAERAFNASRLAELEGSLGRLLAERVIPLRAVRLADGVRSPLASFHERATEELPRLRSSLPNSRTRRRYSAKLCSTPSQLLDGGLATNSAARREIAKDELSATLPELGGQDHAKRWSDFLAGLNLKELTLSLEAEFDHEMSTRGRIIQGAR